VTWEFITKPVRSRNSVAWEWQWQCRKEDGTMELSVRTFSGFRECIADARLHGFTGEADPGEAGTLFQRPETRFRWY
jgi:hypothetical protein